MRERDTRVRVVIQCDTCVYPVSVELEKMLVVAEVLEFA